MSEGTVAEILSWYAPDTPPFRLSGFAWYGRDQVFRRLPLAASGTIPENVDRLSNKTAGGQVAFRSDSSRVAVRVDLEGPPNMMHMPATGQCGFDLYVGPPGARRFHATAKCPLDQSSYEQVLFQHPEAGWREFLLHFPLYQGVKSAQVGLDPEARAAPPHPWSRDGRIIFYGTSITQGACASRPGMAYTNILGRRLNTEIVNLGFSGNGRGEPEVIALVADAPRPCLLVLDYEANSQGRLAETLPVALRILRKRHPSVPMLVISRIAFARDAVQPASLEARDRSRTLQADLVAALRRQGDDAVHFLDGSTLLGEDYDECTVDGVHPNDLGFMRIAHGLEPVLRRLLAPWPSLSRAGVATF